MERAMGIEPTSLAWEARVIPLYDARMACLLTALGCRGPGNTYCEQYPRLHFTASGARMVNHLVMASLHKISHSRKASVHKIIHKK